MRAGRQRKTIKTVVAELLAKQGFHEQDDFFKRKLNDVEALVKVRKIRLGKIHHVDLTVVYSDATCKRLGMVSGTGLFTRAESIDLSRKEEFLGALDERTQILAVEREESLSSLIDQTLMRFLHEIGTLEGGSRLFSTGALDHMLISLPLRNLWSQTRSIARS